MSLNLFVISPTLPSDFASIYKGGTFTKLYVRWGKRESLQH
jgi:hypothetical protein